MMLQEWKIWFRGKVLDGSEFCISPLDAGFQYGDGLFETIKAVDGRICFLKPHLQRLVSSCLENRFEVDLTGFDDSFFKWFLSQAELSEGLVRVKIIVTRGLLAYKGPATTLVMARQERERARGPAVCTVYPKKRSCPMARFKSLSYGYYWAAHRWALANGADYAILKDHRNNLLEADFANILLIEDKTVLRPMVSSYRLTGIVESVLCSRVFPTLGFDVVQRDFRASDLKASCSLILTNSMIDVLPVAKVNAAELMVSTRLVDNVLSQLYAHATEG